jgi:hypothetical protein
MRQRRTRRRLLVRGRELPHADADLVGRRMPLPDMPARGRALSVQASGMKQLANCLAAVALVALVPAAAPAANSIFGKWEIVEAAPAPWTNPGDRAGLVAQGKTLLHLVITFAPNAVNSKFKLFNCTRRVAYETVDLPVDTLFQGNLPEPNPGAVAARMGFPKSGDVPSVDVFCTNAKFTFHFRDPDTALINLNRVIYTLKRQ